MDTKSLSKIINSAINEVEGCYTTTTLKKQCGFIPKNRWNLKWGQVDVDAGKIRIVLDTFPGKYKEDIVKNIIHLPIKQKGSRVTGFLIKRNIKQPPQHDVIEISIYEKDMETSQDKVLKGLLDLVNECAKDSSFKTKSSS
jgi:hypothetical protein